MKMKESLKVNNVELTNRLYMPPMATRKGSLDGGINDDLIEYYRERAEGGYIGLMCTEYSYVSKQGKAFDAQVSVADDCDMEGLKRLTKAVHEVGSTKFICQIVHAGAATTREITGMEIVGPSAVKTPRAKGDEVPHELSLEEIRQVKHDFVEAAKRVKEAGFDGVEIHCAHGYLLNQFFSPVMNKRHDEYGCDSVANRLRLTVEILDEVRAAVGEDYLVAVRLGTKDFLTEGTNVADSVEACKILVEHGCDLLDISGGVMGFIDPDNKEPGYFKDVTKAIKEACDVPVILTGGIQSVKQGEELLAEGVADLIGVGRMLLADPKWAAKEMN